MARKPRLVRAGYTYHVIQRGHNGQTVFGDDSDRLDLLHHMAQQTEHGSVQIHAYVLMSNHVHWLLTPSSDEALARLIQAVGRHYVRRFNLRWHRIGTLWQGRYASHWVASDAYVLACKRYIDLNPVRAGMAEAPEQYRWSSYRALAGLAPDPLVTPHAAWWGLGNTPFEREDAYRRWVAAGLPESERLQLNQSLRSGRPWFPSGWHDPSDPNATPLTPAPRPRGRPRKSS